MVTDSNHTYHSERFIMYRIVEALCCIPKINIISYSNYTSIKKSRPPLKKRKEMVSHILTVLLVENKSLMKLVCNSHQNKYPPWH